MKNFKIYPIITGLFTASLLVSNLLDTKIFMLGSLALPAGIIIFPIAYLFGDFLTEVYGYAASRKVIWTGFVALVGFVLLIEAAKYLPPAPFWAHQNEYEVILGQVPRIVAASITAYFLGEFANSFTLAKLKIFQGGKVMALRFVGSTIVGQAVDTSVFVIIAFGGTMDLAAMLTVIVSAWLVKVLWEVIALPISIPFVKWIKRVENEDHFDTDTNFSPFRLD